MLGDQCDKLKLTSPFVAFGPERPSHSSFRSGGSGACFLGVGLGRMVSIPPWGREKKGGGRWTTERWAILKRFRLLNLRGAGWGMTKYPGHEAARNAR